MNVKTSSNHKEILPGQKKMHEHYIQQSVTTIQINPFHGPAQNLMNRFNVSTKIIDDLLLAAKEIGEEIHLAFVKNRVTSHNTSFCETKKSTITYKKEKKKTPKTFPVLKEDLQDLGLFVSKCTDKKTASTNSKTIQK